MTIAELRMRIDAMNWRLVEILGERTMVAREIARLKKKEQLPVLDARREEAIKMEMRILAKEHGISGPIVEEIFEILLDYTRLEMELVQ